MPQKHNNVILLSAFHASPTLGGRGVSVLCSRYVSPPPRQLEQMHKVGIDHTLTEGNEDGGGAWGEVSSETIGHGSRGYWEHYVILLCVGGRGLFT